MKKHVKKAFNYIQSTQRSFAKKIGLPPGSFVYMGEKQEQIPVIWYFQYNNESFTEGDNTSEDKALEIKELDGVSWINIDGLHDVELIRSLGSSFNIHDLVIEDILNIEHRPKIENQEDYLFVTLKMMSLQKDSGNIDSEQISIILGKGFVLSFQEKVGDVFSPIKDRIRKANGKLRMKDSDFLFYSLIDIIVDNYFLVLEKIVSEIDDLEDQNFINPTADLYERIKNNRKSLLKIQKTLYPLREAIYKLQRFETELIHSSTKKYINDIFDHTVHLTENIESSRELNNSLKDTYLSEIGRQTNRIMQVLTIISTIFIPLTFIVGVYGMNFKTIPELGYDFGYYYLWAVMIAISAVLFGFFKYKKWL